MPAVRASEMQFTSMADLWSSGADIQYMMSSRWSDTYGGRINAVKYNVWAQNCITAREEAFRSVKIKLYQKGATADEADRVIENHDVLRLLTEVNPYNLDETSLKGQTQRQKCLHGEAYWFLVLGLGGTPEEIYLLPAQHVQPVHDSMVFIREFTYLGRPLNAKQVLRFYYPSDDNPLYARSPSSTAIGAINNYNLSDRAQQGLDKRGGQGGGIVSADFTQVRDDPERFMIEWDKTASNPDNAGRDRWLPSGFDYKTGALTPQAMQREERMKRLANEIMAGYRVSPALAGDYSDASVLANAAQQSEVFWTTLMVGELQSFAEQLTYYLLWRFWPESKEQGLYLYPDFTSVGPLAENGMDKEVLLKAKAERAALLYTGNMASLDEARSIANGSEAELEPFETELSRAVLVPTANGSVAMTGPQGDENVLAESEQAAADAQAAAVEEAKAQLAADEQKLVDEAVEAAQPDDTPESDAPTQESDAEAKAVVEAVAEAKDEDEEEKDGQ